MTGGVVDLRSDTVTRPSAAMRAAMADAEVGDDLFGDDPTAIALEEAAAELLGKPAALFVASGTMANLVATLATAGRGTEIVCGEASHLVSHERRGHAALAGVATRTVTERDDGSLDPAAVRAALRADSIVDAGTAMIALENTSGSAQGLPQGPEALRAVADVARSERVAVHLDGARLMNAVTALGVEVSNLTAHVDTVTLCLSKGLGCPVGSVVAGTVEQVARMREMRKLVGGAMRQVGVIAAAGLVELSDGPDGIRARLAMDHDRTRRLAEAVAEMPGICSPGGLAQRGDGPLDVDRVRTNLLYVGIAGGDGRPSRARRDAVLGQLYEAGVWVLPNGEHGLRAVVHRNVDDDGIGRAINAVRSALAAT